MLPEPVIDPQGTRQPAISAAEGDSVLGGQIRGAAVFILMLDHEPETSLLCQASIGVAMHGRVRSGSLDRA